MYVVLEFVRDSPSHAIFVVRKYCCPSFAIAILLCVCVCVILLLMPIFLLEHIVVHLPLLPFFFVKLLCFTSTYFSLNLLLLIHEFINDS